MRDASVPAELEPAYDNLESAAAVVAAWCGESLLHAGEDCARALAPGTARRGALDAALKEIDSGLARPSADFRRRFALMLGLERVLSEPTPALASGLTLRAHQVDALAGMLAALIGDFERGEDEEHDDDDEDAEDDVESEAEVDTTSEDADDDEDAAEGEDDDEGPGLDVVAESEDDADELDEAEVAPPDPGARRRYRFKHPTASGKTVAAAGFVDACRTAGVLILTHRRLLVDQFQRDLREQGYGPRLWAAIDRGRRIPEPPPVTVETYAWFIKHHQDLDPDAYAVVLCDEAHTALGERTSASIRKFSKPTYIGMTATDQLLQKHVSDVFPAEIADFPLSDAVRRGVVAPLRCLRVRPGASLRNVPVVGGDFDQALLAAALDHEALNMAAAGYYAERFGDRAGIIYAAGVEHAENVALALRAAGVKAKSVSGRTPPRVLAETLAAYERGETNVLVNAQLLAEGWNAPRATICMHLAPTASRRVYQQRVGRVMRLHRRKEAGVVVDFADPAAPHSDRTVTLHSLLDADVYRPGALVTPRPPRRRQRWRRTARPVVREVDWFVPVADDPERRRAAIVADWKSVAADMLPPDEQELWAETAARRVAPTDLTRLTATLAKVSEETRITFFATCAAECKHRALRLAALGDLASRHPDPNTVERVVRLIEAAPTWAADRAQGARVLLLALGEGGFAGSLSQRVAWMWRLAKASREVQFRVATAGSTQARDLLRAMASARGDDHHVKARLLVMAANQADLAHGAAMLAVAVVHDSTAGRLIDNARVDMGEDAESLALALASNIPAQTERARPKARRRRVKARTTTGASGTTAVKAVPAAVPESKAEEAVEDAAPAADGEPTAATPLAKGADGAPSRS
ncbi:MAG: DEAD/DEAH box helicase family protein, partial [Gaiellales bacterium]